MKRVIDRYGRDPTNDQYNVESMKGDQCDVSSSVVDKGVDTGLEKTGILCFNNYISKYAILGFDTRPRYGALTFRTLG